MTPALLRRKPIVFSAGVLLGALVLILVPGSWLFREPPGADQVADLPPGARYACPMFCTMADEPGTCPVCGMEMELVRDQGERVPLGARDRYMAGIRTAPVVRRLAAHRIRALGRIRHDERREARVTAWVGGRIDELAVDFTGTVVEPGQRVARLYAPELLSAQEELIGAHRALQEAEPMAGSRSAERSEIAREVYEATRRRLRLLGVPESTVDEIVETGEAREHLDVFAKVGGTVVRKWVREGDYVETGDPLFSVVDLEAVWAMLEVFEEDAGAVRAGQAVEVRVPGLPGETWPGTVAFVDPMLQEHRRIVEVRVDLPNPSGRLRPGLFAEGEILVPLTRAGRVHDATSPESEAGPALLVPRSAVLQGGEVELVYVMTQRPGPEGEDGHERWPAIYEPREIQTGFRVGDDLVVLAGLTENDVVVTRGQFLIDSQLQLTGKPSLLIPQASGAVPTADPHAGH